MPLAIRHHISIPAPATHLVHVETVVSDDARALPETIVLFMAVWTPGSYLVREYARHVEGFSIEAPASAKKIRKNAWQVSSRGAARVTVRYEVYAGELTVRTSHVDETHAFLVGAGIFLGVEGHENLGAQVEIVAPIGWRVATPLPAAPGAAHRGHCFDAPSFDVLIDSPIELGPFRDEPLDVLAIPHRLLFCPAGAIADADVRRLLDDTRVIVEQLARFFGGRLPYEAYLLMVHLSAHARGGLEHRSSAALIASPTNFSTRGGYLELLSLIAHEMFHAWNVKRIRPAGLVPYRYDEECYTRLLWWFEGATSYYDWRTLALCHLCTVDEYLDHLASEIAYVDQTPGRFLHSLEDASYDAWIKLYRPDENLANSTVSYYRKGEIVCALLDIELRARTAGRVTLDHVLEHLWTHYGAHEKPVPEEAMQGILERMTGLPWSDVFDGWIRGTSEIDYARTFSQVGLGLVRAARTEGAGCSLGIRPRADAARSVVSSVVRSSGAWSAGIASGDEIIAVGSTRVEAGGLDAALRGLQPGETVEVVFARLGQVHTRSVTLDAPRLDTVKLVPLEHATPSCRSAFAAWQGREHPAWATDTKAMT